MTTCTELDLTADVIDVRDIIARYEELDEMDDGLPDAEERYQLSVILTEIKDTGGDEQWRGDWYPVTLIRDSYFKEYAQELAEDIGAVDVNATWPNNCIDWEHAARELRHDYTGVDVAGVTYWTR